jgi:hypothetical protein
MAEKPQSRKKKAKEIIRKPQKNPKTLPSLGQPTMHPH